MKTARIIVSIIAIIIMAFACVWLAGFLFYAFSKVDPFGKTNLTTWIECWNYYKDINVVIRKRLVVSMLAAIFICYGVPILAIYAANNKKRSLYGDAKFASYNDIVKADLFCEKGVIIGKFKNRYLVFKGQQFILLAAPTRSGKGVGVVIPNLLHFDESVVVLDIKMENYKMTAGYRKRCGQEVFLFAPFTEDYMTARYNPLDYVRDGDFRVGDLNSIGEVFFPSGGSGTDTFFDNQARNLFVGLGLYLCETPELPRTIGEMLRQSSGKGLPIKDYIESLINERNYVEDELGEKQPKIWDGTGLPPLSMECVDALNRFIGTSDNTRSSILASFNAPLGIWANPIVDAATSASDFDLRDVRRKKMSIYIGITPSYLAEAATLVNLMFSQLINLNTKTLPDKVNKYQCLLVMDEFTSIGTVGIIDKSVAYIAGYNLRLLIIVQSPAQLENNPPKGYGQKGAKNLIVNHACKILFAPQDQEDCEAYSKLLGDTTVKSRSVNLKERSNGSESDHRRALMLPQEVKAIGQKKEIISLENMLPIFCDKVAYFADNNFMARLKSVSPKLAAIKGFPSKEQLDDAADTWDLAPKPPLLDIETHKAKIMQQVRTLTLADVNNESIDLNALAINLNELPVPTSEGVNSDEIVAFVDNFFDQLTRSNEAFSEAEDGSLPSITDDELLLLEQEALSNNEPNNSVSPDFMPDIEEEEDVEPLVMNVIESITITEELEEVEDQIELDSFYDFDSIGNSAYEFLNSIDEVEDQIELDSFYDFDSIGNSAYEFLNSIDPDDTNTAPEEEVEKENNKIDVSILD